jgi:hypothetical protein
MPKYELTEVVILEDFTGVETHVAAGDGSYTETCSESIVWIRGHFVDET